MVIPDADVELVAGRCQLSKPAARHALELTDGDLAHAVELCDSIEEITHRADVTYEEAAAALVSNQEDVAGAMQSLQGASAELHEADVDILATRTGVDRSVARSALEATDGDLAGAVERLESGASADADTPVTRGGTTEPTDSGTAVYEDGQSGGSETNVYQRDSDESDDPATRSQAEQNYCPSCGTELTTESQASSTFCPHCGSRLST
jgi:NACalpha-BTF3-like transcription factor